MLKWLWANYLAAAVNKNCTVHEHWNLLLFVFGYSVAAWCRMIVSSEHIRQPCLKALMRFINMCPAAFRWLFIHYKAAVDNRCCKNQLATAWKVIHSNSWSKLFKHFSVFCCAFVSGFYNKCTSDIAPHTEMALRHLFSSQRRRPHFH